MKKILTAITLLIIVFAGCNNDDDNTPQNPVSQLPPPTQSGENTFGCLINGEPFVVRNTNNISAIYQEGQLQFGATVEANSNSDESVSFNLVNPLNVNQTYNFNNYSYYAGYSKLTENSICNYGFEDTYQGSIKFTKIDTQNFIIAGTFEFSTVTEGCIPVEITNGRFDMQYIP